MAILSIHDVSKECRKSVTLSQNVGTQKTGILNIKALENSNLAKMPIWNIKQQSSESEVDYKMEFQNYFPSNDTKTRLVWYPSTQSVDVFITWRQKRKKQVYLANADIDILLAAQTTQLLLFPFFIQYKTMPGITKRFIRRGVW